MRYPKYSDINNNVMNDPKFFTDVDKQYNPKQSEFYGQVNKQLIKIKKPINENLRQIQINTYYYKRYKSENYILYFIMFILTFLIIIALIKQKYAYLDDLAYSVIVGTILALSLLYISYSTYLIIMKDDSNYDEDNFMFNTSIEDIPIIKK
jgi:hypothetical protein